MLYIERSATEFNATFTRIVKGMCKTLETRSAFAPDTPELQSPENRMNRLVRFNFCFSLQ